MLTQIMDYLDVQGLKLDKQAVQIALVTLHAVRQAERPVLTPGEALHYQVPYPGEMLDYDLSPLFSDPTAALPVLSALHGLLDSVKHHTGADWLGVYCARGAMNEARLVKLAYRGAHGLAELPLTQAFAEGNNSSRVALTGWGTVIDAIEHWPDAGEPDSRVRSGVALPICTVNGAVLGLIEAKSYVPAFFDEEKQTWLVALALAVPTILAGLPLAEDV